MRLGIIHLSDIHFRKTGNPLFEVVDQLAAAVQSADPSVSMFLVVVSGDIAWSGKSAEYEIATQFFQQLRQQLQLFCPQAQVRFISIPGNHDCVLPEKGQKLRETLIQGIIPSLQESRQDEAILKELTKAQAPYNKFRKSLGKTGPWNGLCETVVVEHEGKKIQLNLYNTALLSKRFEQQGELYLPVGYFSEHVNLDKNAGLSISVFHHSYLWLNSNISVEFRNHIEKTSDIALSGHQHYSHDFYKENSTGERILYIEAPALQDESFPRTSSFQILLFDWDLNQERSIKFRRSKELFRSVHDTGWRALPINRAIRAQFRLSTHFETALNSTATPLYHKVKGLLNLRDVFVFPDLSIRTAGVRPRTRDIRGEDTLSYISTARRILFQGASLSGKSSLARMLFLEIYRQGNMVPLLLAGHHLKSAAEDKVLSNLWGTFANEYSGEMLDEFKQLNKTERVLIVDDWHRTQFNSEGRRDFLGFVSSYFDKIFLFTDELFQIHELINKSPDTILGFDHVDIQAFNHRLRGQLIDRWVTLGREHTGDSKTLIREIDQKEQLIESVMGKNTLPKRPFFVLSILQADQEEKADVAEAGSFGYLYELLVTVALSQSKGAKAQLEKKYTFLAILAYRMFKHGNMSMSLSQVKDVAAEYARSHLITVDVTSMLNDLEEAHVLLNIDGNCSFAYWHLFFYFVARYYRDNLDRDEKLRIEVEEIANHVASGANSSILMFIIYFARDSSDIVKKLVANADKIYSGELPADLDTDVAFLNKLCDRPVVEVPEEVDVVKNRQDRRERNDMLAKNSAALPIRDKHDVTYNDQLSDSDKFDLAYTHLGLLGQVIRNFPGSLPGPEKLLILKSTYLLGLRMLRALVRMLDSSLAALGKELTAAMKNEENFSDEKITNVVNRLVLFLSRICTLHVITQVSGNVGVADLESAYNEALLLVGKTNASELINLAIKLDHDLEFPLSEIRALHKQFSNNAFADTVLSDLVLSRLSVIDVDRRIRQSVGSLFKLPANLPVLIDSGKS
jgi:hypothetical protein